MLREARNHHHHQSRSDAGVVSPSTLAFLLGDNAFIIVLSALLGLTLALAYLQWTAPVFAARARLEIAGNESILNDFQKQNAATEDVASAQILKTVEQTIASNAVLARVVAANRLADDPELSGAGLDPAEGALIERFRHHIDVNLIRGTRLIGLEVTANNPDKAARWLQSILDAFFSQGRESSRRQSTSNRAFLLAEAERLAQNLHDSELRLQQYREKYDAMAIADRQNLVIDQLRHLHAQLSDARNARLTLEPEQAQVQAALDSGSLTELMNLQAIATRSEVAELRQKLDVLNNQVAAYALPYGENHPVLQQARRQRDETADALKSTVDVVAASILHNYQAARKTEELLEKELQHQEQTAVELDRVSIPYHALERELQSDTALHAQVLARLKQSDLVQNLVAEQNFSDSFVHVIDTPFASAKPVRPVWHLVLAGGLIGGAAIGLLLAVLRHLFDDSVPSVDAAEACLGVPALAVVPRSRLLRFRGGRYDLPGPGVAEAEPFRLLRTTLALREDGASQRTMLFTSAVPGEGKTCCSVNYAAALAQSGLRTLLIDGDLRRPKLRTALQRTGVKFSFADCLTDPARLGSAIDTTSQTNLFLLGNPHGTARAAELLAGDNLRLVLEKCGELFDRIVIDTAPVAVVSDALCFARYVPTICLVVRAGHTPRRLVLRARNLITEVAGRPLTGVVLNQIRRDRAASYGYYLAHRYPSNLAMPASS
jgi:capsular exopolysaccharide synthesis family protein